MTEPALSVVVPVGRIDALLEEQLDALARQETDRWFEVVLAGNAPSADAQHRLQRLAGGRGRAGWRAIAAHARRGPSHARNQGALAATGELLAFCDADDVVHPTWLEELAIALAHHDAVGGRLIGFGLRERSAAARPPATPGELPRFMAVPYILTANLGVRRAAFLAVGGFDESLETCEDIAFSWSLLAAGCSLGWAPDACVAYRHRAGVRAMVSQHARYGRGMSQLLLRYGIPDGDSWASAGRRLVRGNGQPGAARSALSSLRRASIAAGRLAGLVTTGPAVALGWAPGPGGSLAVAATQQQT